MQYTVFIFRSSVKYILTFIHCNKLAYYYVEDLCTIFYVSTAL